MSFLYYYIRSMRLYYAFVTGSTVLAGLVLGAGENGVTWNWQTLLALVAGYLIWGVNQIFNDWSGLAEDRINAPHRPMVCGKLPIVPALVLSLVLELLFGAIFCWINPWLLAPLLVGVVLNLVYSWLKGWPIVGCLVYGAAISCCFLFGIILACPQGIVFPHGTWNWFLVFVLIHALMCHFSYFKDVVGDGEAGKRTLQVVLGVKRAFWLVEIPTVFLLLLYWSQIFQIGNWPLMFGIAVSAVLFGLLSLQMATDCSKKIMVSTCLNCLLCTALSLLPVLAVDPGLWPIFPVSLVLILVIFNWYRDEKE
ncbi:MAG: UbiA family prenyltransferase [Thermoguttaceae bacterium]|nr:UbiA family prenyltransferase [Thermoguttaceae bacterium]MBQ9456664.1 UbiA family prenyltransferase [Thermoguttaceae bacterium]